MGYLKGKKVYLSGPIHSSIDSGTEWRNLVTPSLIDLGLEILDPCKKEVCGDVQLSEVGKNKEKFKNLILEGDWSTVKKNFWPIVRCDL